jgi:hypothetical protein
VSESSATVPKKKCSLHLDNFRYHLLQNSLLGNVYSTPTVFPMLQKHRGTHFPWCCRVPLAVPFACQTLFQNVVPSVSISIWETKRYHRVLSLTIILLLVTNSVVFRDVWAVTLSGWSQLWLQFQSFSSHIFSQASQNITVKVRVVHSVMRNKFAVNIPVTSKRKQGACSLLNSGAASSFLLLVIMGSSTETTVALFLEHNHKSNFHQPLWS